MQVNRIADQIFPQSQLAPPILARVIADSSSSLQSAQAVKKNSLKQKFWLLASYLFHPLYVFYEWVMEKMGLTDNELDLSKETFNKMVSAIGAIVLDRAKGEKIFHEVLGCCYLMNEKLKRKWFQNTKGMLLIRENFLKFELVAQSFLGNVTCADALVAKLKKMDGDTLDEKAVKIILALTQDTAKSRFLCKLINWDARLHGFVASLFFK